MAALDGHEHNQAASAVSDGGARSSFVWKTFAATPVALVSSALVLGCPGAPGRDAGVDAPPERCEVDTACPDQAPLSGGLCEGALRCRYPHLACGGGPFAETYECREGRWMLAETTCIGAPPTLAESCRTPTIDWPDGARFEITPDLPGAPAFADGEPVEIVIGPQGGAMVPYRIRIEGLETTPTCIRSSARVSLDGMSSTDTKQLRLRCGTTLRVYEILPRCPPPGEHDVTLEVTVDGLGSRSVRLVGSSTEPCPRAEG